MNFVSLVVPSAVIFDGTLDSGYDACMQPENQQFVQSLIDEGVFVTPDEVVDAALHRWRTQREETARLQAKVHEGLEELDRGEGAPLDVEDVIAEGRKRLAANSTR